jgi:hypothetical protein
VPLSILAGGIGMGLAWDERPVVWEEDQCQR